MINILLVDDESKVRQGWRMRLALEADMTVVGEAANVETAVPLAGVTRPDVILLDIKMPRQDGLSAIRQFHRAAPGCKVIIVTIYDSPRQRAGAKAEGAVAFIAKQESPEHLLAAIRMAFTTLDLNLTS